MSPRRWLEAWPLRLRALVLVLALLQFVAPSWHVCALGGHTLHCSAQSSEANTFRPVICFCRADYHNPTSEYAKNWPVKLTAADQNAPFCLARLLQNLPGHSTPIAVPPVSAIQTSTPPAFPPQESALLQPVFTLRGRGPPPSC